MSALSRKDLHPDNIFPAPTEREVDLAVVGNLLIDELPGGRVEPGGAALYTCLAARKCGLSVGLHSVVGEDYPLEILERARVSLSLKRLSGPGGRSLISYGPEGRSLEHRGPGHLEMSPQTPSPFRGRLIHLAPMPWDCQLYHLDCSPPSSVILDPFPPFTEQSWSDLKPLQDRLRYLLLNQEETVSDLSFLPLELPVLVKQGAEGGYCRRNGRRWAAKACEVVDLTGAGDSFAAGLAAAILRDLEPELQFELAAEMAALALSANGPWGLVGSQSEVPS